ncbi:MAG: A/G-specific adenine glycosylase [Gammaproteobacteria bacterium]|jgi:A/G-specific adenine glycosylase
MSTRKQRVRDARVESLAQDGARRRHLRTVLTTWYLEVRRDLPWRRTQDAYAIWISEAMLQQTRVEAVLDHYARFLKRFPTVQSLARAEEDDVVGMWSGLGYYNRARTLRRAAQVIVTEHAGRFPDQVEAAAALPGVGDYTVGAVLSIAYGRGVALVDGNVARVFARLFGVLEEIDRGPTQRMLWDLAQVLVPNDHDDARAPQAPGTWNQALMEFGALFCTPRSPRCEDCRLRPVCIAHAEGLVDELPRKRPKKPPIDVRIEVLVARRGNDVLLVRRPIEDRMGGMWEMPTREVLTGTGEETYLWPRAPHGPAGLVEEKPASLLGQLSHSITKHRITADLREALVQPAVMAFTDANTAAWFDVDKLSGVGLTGLTRKALKRVLSTRLRSD